MRVTVKLHHHSAAARLSGLSFLMTLLKISVYGTAALFWFFWKIAVLIWVSMVVTATTLRRYAARHHTPTGRHAS